MPGRAEWFVFGLGVGLGFVLAQAFMTWLLAAVTRFVNEFAMASKYRALGVPGSVILEHEGRISRRLFYACRRGCIICEDLGLLVKEDLSPPPVAMPTTPSPPPDMPPSGPR